MTKLALMPTAAAGMPSFAVFAGALDIREAHIVTSPVATGHVSGVSAAAAAHVAYVGTWDNRQAKSAPKSANWAGHPPRGLTP